MSTLSKAKIIAIGGAGIKIATRLVEKNLISNEVIGIDLSAQEAPFEIISVGNAALGLLGSGGDPDVAVRAFEGSKAKIEQHLKNNDWYIILAGLGGGTASALAPLVAEAAVRCEALVMAFVTMPFNVEGSRRVGQARESLERIRKTIPCVIPLANEALLTESNPETAFAQSDTIIASSLRSLGSINSYGSQIEVDYDTFKKTFTTKTKVKPLFSVGSAEGSDAIDNITADVFNFPLLNSGALSRYADELLVCIRASDQFGLAEFERVSQELAQKVGASKTRLVSAKIEPEWESRMEVMLLGLYPTEVKKTPVSPLAKKKKKKGVDAKTSAQTELPFESVTYEKGIFDQSETVYFRGEDIDVPTYMRRGVKLMS